MNNPGLFAYLKLLEHGDYSRIHIEGKAYTYEVRRNFQVVADDMSVLEHLNFDTVTLLTSDD